MIRSVGVITLLAFVAQAHGKEGTVDHSAYVQGSTNNFADEFVQKLNDKLTNRLQAMSVDEGNLDDTAVGKARPLTSQSKGTYLNAMPVNNVHRSKLPSFQASRSASLASPFLAPRSPYIASRSPLSYVPNAEGGSKNEPWFDGELGQKLADVWEDILVPGAAATGDAAKRIAFALKQLEVVARTDKEVSLPVALAAAITAAIEADEKVLSGERYLPPPKQD